MSKDTKRQEEKEFQYDLTKLQVDYEFTFTMLIGVIAILYGLLSFYRDNPIGYGLTIIMIFVAVISLSAVHRVKEKKFQAIRKKYKLFTKTET
jgi:membrane protein YdbS with pleckstrin-like domain